MELNKKALLSEEKTGSQTDPLYPEEIKMYTSSDSSKYQKIFEDEKVGSEESVRLVLVFLKKKTSIELTFAENKLLDSNSNDLLEKLKKNNIKCQILDFTQYICVIISIDNKEKALNYIDNHNIFVPTDSNQLVIQGRQMHGFTAAHQTYIYGEDTTFQVKVGDNYITYAKIDIAYWNHVYMPYKSTLSARIFKSPILSQDTTKKLLNIALNNELDLPNEYKTMLDDIFILNIPSDVQNMPYWKCFCFIIDEYIAELRDSYGASVGFYFTFSTVYNKMLILMSVMGFISFLCQIIEGEVALRGLTIFLIVAVLTVTFFHNHVWIRKEMSCMIKWGIIQSTQIQGSTWCATHVQPNNTGNFYFFSLPTLTCFICSIISIVVNIAMIESIYKNSEISFIIVTAAGILIGILIFILNYIYLRLSKYVHTKNITVYHQIFFFFINSFCSLYYLTFFQEDNDNHKHRFVLLQIHIICVFITICVCRNLWKFIQIKIKCCAKNRYKINDNSLQDENATIYDIRKQLSFDSANFNFTDNMLHKIVICYGFMILFIVICPIMTVLSLLVCIIEIRIDLWNLIFHSRRQLYPEIRGIGIWNDVFHLFTLLSVITNMSFIVFETDLVSDIIDSDIANIIIIIYFFVVTVFLLALLQGKKTFFDPLTAKTTNMLLIQDCCMKYLFYGPLESWLKRYSNKLISSSDVPVEELISESDIEEFIIHHNNKLEHFPFFKFLVEILRSGLPWKDPMKDYKKPFTEVEYEYYYSNFAEFKAFYSKENYKSNLNTFDEFDDMNELLKDAICAAMSERKIFPFDDNIMLLRDDATQKCYVIDKTSIDITKTDLSETVQDITKNFVRFARYIWLKEMVLYNQDDEFNIFRNICFDINGYKDVKNKLIDNIPVVKYKPVQQRKCEKLKHFFSSNIFDYSETFLSKIKMFLGVLCIVLQIILTTAVISDVSKNWPPDYDTLSNTDESIIVITATAVFIGISFMTSITIFKYIIFYKHLSVICSIPWIIAFFDFISNVVIGIAITSVSFFFLVQSETFSDVVLNSFALTFILELDDIINRFESDEDYIIEQEFSWVDDLSSFTFFNDYGYNFMFKRKIILPVDGFSDVLLFFISLPMFFIFSLLLALKAFIRLFNCNNFYDRTGRTYVYSTYYQSLCTDDVGHN